MAGVAGGATVASAATAAAGTFRFTFRFTFFVFLTPPADFLDDDARVYPVVPRTLCLCACNGKPSKNNLVCSPTWLFVKRINAVAVIADPKLVKRSVIHRSAPPIN